MSTFTARTFAQVFADARAKGLLNEAAQDVYTDAALLPHGAKALSHIELELAASGIPLLETTASSFVYTAGAETVPVPGGITDLREPLELWEKTVGTTLWVPMEQVSYLRPPLETNLDTLGIWEWRNGTIRVLPCSVNRDVFVRYRRELDYPTVGSTMGFDGIYHPLVSRTAFLAAPDRPDIQAAALNSYVYEMGLVIRVAGRDREGIVYRREPWGSSPQRRIRQEPA